MGKKIYEDFCQRTCSHLKLSERRCYRGDCYLKNFFDEILLKIPQETMLSLSEALHGIRIDDVLKKSRYGIVLRDVRVEGKTIYLVFDDSELDESNKLKARYLNPEEVVIMTIYKVILTAPNIQEVKVRCSLSTSPEFTVSTTRQRAVELLGHQGMAAIKRDWNSIWDYFKPILKDNNFASKVRSFLNSYTNENPLSGKTTGEERKSSGWLGKFVNN